MRFSLLEAAHVNLVGAAHGEVRVVCRRLQDRGSVMSKMLRKRLIPIEFLVASSLLLAPSLALTGYGQNSPPTATTHPNHVATPSPTTATPSDTPPAESTPPGPATDPKMPGVKAGSIDDVNAVGTRDIGGRGMGNWYSTESEIRMGKSYAMQLEKSVKFINDPVVNRVREPDRAKPGEELGRQGSFYHQGHRFR